MGAFRLDLEGIMTAPDPAAAPWSAAPAGTCVGHVHLKVGEAPRAGRWRRETPGFQAVGAREAADFLSTGGYHHHVAVNQWLSAGAGRRSEREAGLDFVELRRAAPGVQAEYEDDWGAVIRVV